MQAHTILLAHTTKHDVAILVHLNVADTKPTPFFEQNGNLLARSPPGYREAKVLGGRFDAKQTSKPILLWFDVPFSDVFPPHAIMGRPCRMTKHSDRLGAGRVVKVDILRSR